MRKTSTQRKKKSFFPLSRRFSHLPSMPSPGGVCRAVRKSSTWIDIIMGKARTSRGGM
jgi:hypothetical protein